MARDGRRFSSTKKGAAMTGTRLQPTRRAFLQGSTGAMALGAFAASRAGRARAQDFPARNIVITIPTAEGGGADRDVRNFTAVWQNHIDTNFEFDTASGP
jgi:tripartite-type tricarboxylate transporter receptor subunit TctC